MCLYLSLMRQWQHYTNSIRTRSRSEFCQMSTSLKHFGMLWRTIRNLEASSGEKSDTEAAAEETATEVDWVLGRDQFISSIICFLGTHPDEWTKEEHWGCCGQGCGCCRAAHCEVFGACEVCNQIPILTCINRQWRDRTSEFDGKVMLPAGHSPI